MKNIIMFTNLVTEKSFRVCSLHCLIVKNLQQQKHLANSGLQSRQKIVQKSQPGWKMNLTFYYFIRSWIRLWLWSTLDMTDRIRKSNWVDRFDKHPWELWSSMECLNRVLELLSLDFYLPFCLGLKCRSVAGMFSSRQVPASVIKPKCQVWDSAAPLTEIRWECDYLCDAIKSCWAFCLGQIEVYKYFWLVDLGWMPSAHQITLLLPIWRVKRKLDKNATRGLR